ncbi:hypothetical protein GCM10027187_17950 [Streptosporangium sandarakinum]
MARAVRLDGGSVRLNRVGRMSGWRGPYDWMADPYGSAAWTVRVKDSPGRRSVGLSAREKPLVPAAIGVR